MNRVEQEQGVTVVELAPRYESLDDEALDGLAKTLLEVAATAEPPVVLLDFTATSMIGSRSIEALVRAWKRLCDRRGTLALCGLQPFCAEVLRITHLDTLWEQFPDRATAIAAMQSGGGSRS